VIRIANVQMARALRRVSVEQGHDPRHYCLLPFGGGGPLHACDLARLMGMRRILVPPHPGTLSALGLLLSYVVKDYAHTVMAPTEQAAPLLAARFAELERQAAEEMTAEGLTPAEVSFHASVDMRYQGQSYELAVPLADGRSGVQVFRCSGVRADQDRPLLILADPEHLNTRTPEHLNTLFHERHAARYGRASPGQPTEIVQMRLQAVGETRKPELSRRKAPAGAGAPNPLGAHPVWFEEWRETPLYRRGELLPGHRLEGPALLLQADTTTLVTPGWRGEVDSWGNLILTVG
jgi:N-methylhydantoinase A